MIFKWFLEKNPGREFRSRDFEFNLNRKLYFRQDNRIYWIENGNRTMLKIENSKRI